MISVFVIVTCALVHPLTFHTLHSVIESHNGLTALMADKLSVSVNNDEREFDALWISSLTQSTAAAKVRFICAGE